MLVVDGGTPRLIFAPFTTTTVGILANDNMRRRKHSRKQLHKHVQNVLTLLEEHNFGVLEDCGLHKIDHRAADNGPLIGVQAHLTG